MTATTCSDELSGLEIATGMVFGEAARRDRLQACTRSGSLEPLDALERSILPALQRPPCLVSFSGGRDSSAVLAVATAISRRHGLAPPIPATNVFPAANGSDEDLWQHRVVRHLRLREWVRIEHRDELDLIGPYAQRVLCRHGLLWPFNVHFHLPLLDAAAGGSLLTGFGGDELFAAATRDRASAVLAGAVRPRPRDPLRIAFAFAPLALRRRVLRRREWLPLPWLRQEAAREGSRALAELGAQEPRRLAERLSWARGLRYLATARASLDLIGMDARVLLVHPLLGAELWSAVGRVTGPHGVAGRTDGMRRLFGELLPDAICARGSKALFDGAFWTPRAHWFAHSWDGSGVPAEWVDVDSLAAHWRTEQPAANSFTLLQAAWLASSHGVEQTRQRVGA
jgi:asparagine synthase (glutamine-hydrolysing)